MYKKQESKQSSTPDQQSTALLPMAIIEEVHKLHEKLGSNLMGIVASYASDDRTMRRIVLGTQGYFTPRINFQELLQSAFFDGNPDNVIAILRKNPEFLRKKVDEFTLPCGTILKNFYLIQGVMFILDGHMLLHNLKPFIDTLPEEDRELVYEQCLDMRGGGADLVKMTLDPRTVNFSDVMEFVEGDRTFPMLVNNNGILFCNGQFFLADQRTQTVMEIKPNIPPNQQAVFDEFAASLNAMEDNSSRRSSDNEREFIRLTMGVTLERRGICYQRDGVWYQDTEVGMDLSNAYRRYIRLYKDHAHGTPWDDVDAAWLAVGMKQRQIPILQRICEAKSFEPLPSEESFMKDPFNRSLQFSICEDDGWKQDNIVVPFTANAGLGVQYSLYKSSGGRYPARGAAASGPGSRVWAWDLTAHCRIVKVGKICTIEFVKNFENQRTVYSNTAGYESTSLKAHITRGSKAISNYLKKLNKAFYTQSNAVPLETKVSTLSFLSSFSSNSSLSSHSSSNQVKLSSFKSKTKNDGDCGFHAVLGVADRNGVIVCSDTPQRRAELAQHIRDCKESDVIYNLASEGIKALIMSGREIGKVTKKCLQEYHAFLDRQDNLNPQHWKAFKKTLREYPDVIQWISTNHQVSVVAGKAPNLRSQFYDAMNRDDNTLFGLMFSIPLLHKAFLDYNALQNAAFGWHQISREMLLEYANFICKDGQWLLQCEIALIAHVFNVTVHYFPVAGATPEILNPGQRTVVEVQFNGRNHFERLLSLDEHLNMQQTSRLK